MNIYFDCEFTGLQKDTTLISIGLIAEDGRKFYAELNDYDKTQVNEWIQDNVVANLSYNEKEHYMPKESIEKCKSYACKSDKSHVGRLLGIWLGQFDKIQFVSDVSHYDFVLLVDLLAGHAFNLPENVSPSCHDINQDIAAHYMVPDWFAFDMNREELLADCDVVVKGLKHNALYDAKVIKELYKIVGGN